MKFATNLSRHYPSHLRNVATLRWEIKNLNFLQQYKNFENRLIYDKVTDNLKVGTFRDTV